MANPDLYPYQIEGRNWLVTKKIALLADQMGLGKTRQVIAAADHLGLRRVLVIAPAIARHTWKNEFQKWSVLLNRKVRVLEKLSDTPDHHDQVVLVSFDYAARNVDKLNKWSKDLLVVDESHFLKSIDAKRTKAVLSKNGIIHTSPRSWFLTGTPMPNHPAELWPLMRASGATQLNYTSFADCFCTYYDFNGKKVYTGMRAEKRDHLSELLNRIMLRRLTKNVLKDLPKVTVGEVFVDADISELPRIAPNFEEILRALEIIDINKQMDALETLAPSISTLRRYCAFRKIEPVSKLVAEELDAGAYKKIVIFCWHTEVVNGLIQNLKAFNPVAIVGDVSNDQRQRNIERFQTDETCRVLVGNIKAAGTNITLTAANQVLFVEQSWVPGDNAQAIARCARIGQTLPVFARIVSIADSIDQKINESLMRKTGDIESLLGVT